jgi:dephospho-CoA kinase
MIKIGLTGGMGAGKSTVAQLFKEQGIPVFNSDLCARDAEKETHIREGFKRILGDDIYVDGELDRPKMRKVIFTDKDKLKQVNELVTPYVKKSFDSFCDKNKESHQIVMLESAILFENKHESNFDYIVTVTASENTRLKRVMKRDNLTAEEVVNKFNNQLPEIDKMKKSDFIIFNESGDIVDSIEILTIQIKTIIKAISGDLITKTLHQVNESLKE